MMPDVEHQKWWGWGVEGVAFDHTTKPAFAPFVETRVGVNVHTAAVVGRPRFEQLAVPASRATDGQLDSFRKVVGGGNVVLDDELRVVHWAGKSVRDLLRTRAGDFPRVPDVVLYPGTEDEVQRLVTLAHDADCVLIPFGGGSSISGSLSPEPDEQRTVISLDLGRLNQVLDVDEHSGIARIQAGVLGPDLEDQLNARGLTLGHVPDSFKHSTLGGWVATRSSGMQSDKYGDIADIVRGLRMARPGGALVLRDLPSTSSGPSLREMVLGSEGRLGVITQVTVQVHRLPEKRVVLAYMFPDFDRALAAMRGIQRSDAGPAFGRVSDANETSFSLATQKAATTAAKKVSSAGQQGLWRLLRARGWDTNQMCISYICYEGSAQRVAGDRRIVKDIMKRHGAITLGSGPGELYDQKKFDTPYLRDFLLDRSTIGDVSETAAPWSRLAIVRRNVYAAAHGAFESLGRRGFIMCHMSHSYHSGACLYFTFAFVASTSGRTLEEYGRVKDAIQQTFVDSGATLSHHHGVGTEHSAWMPEDVSPEGTAVMRGLFDASDPKNILNPGKILTGPIGS
ncbi:FAD-binding oxidoreductase [Arthrobacter pigmenti]